MFQINSITAGWFGFTLNSETDNFHISCSKVCGIDIAEQFVLLAYNLLFHKPYQQYFCLNSEKEVYRMELNTLNNYVRILICKIEDKPFNYINATKTVLMSANIGNPVFTIDADIISFVEEIYNAFSNISIESYENSWFKFPSVTYNKLANYMKYR